MVPFVPSWTSKREGGSIIHMCKRFLKFENLIAESHTRIVREKVNCTGNGPAAPFSAEDRIVIELRVNVFQNNEDATTILGKKGT